jgi:5-methylthioribose kinase
MIRRSVGFAHVLDVDSIADDTKRAEALQMNLQAGERLIRSHQVISGFADIVGIVRSVIDS